MDAAALPAPDSTRLAELQRTAQLKLGGCLLRLQQYELLLKAMVANTDLAGEPAQLQAVRDAQVASVHKTTLGGLVSLFTGGYLRLEGESPHETDDKAPSDRVWFSIQQRMEVSAEHFEAITADLRELVDLRNELVHHLLERFDLGQLEPCEAALTYLEVSRATIDRHYQTLRTWAEHMENVRVEFAAFVQSDSFEDLLRDSIAPAAKVNWPTSGIVCSLRDAEQALAPSAGKECWTELNAAIAWINRQHPDQRPKRYGCSSWRQVLHESQQFEVKKKLTPAPVAGGGHTSGTVVCYRSRREHEQ